VVAEKILAPGEALPPDWAVAGTTGYEFLNAVTEVFVTPTAAKCSTAYQGFTGLADFNQMVSSAKKMTMLVAMSARSTPGPPPTGSPSATAAAGLHARSLTFASARSSPAAGAPTGPEGARTGPAGVEGAVEEAKRWCPELRGGLTSSACRAPGAVQDFAESTGRGWSRRSSSSDRTSARSVETPSSQLQPSGLLNRWRFAGRYGVSVPPSTAEMRSAWLAARTLEHVHARHQAERMCVPAQRSVGTGSGGRRRWAAGPAEFFKEDRGRDQPAPDRNDEYLLYQTSWCWPDELLGGEAMTVRGRIADYMRATKGPRSTRADQPQYGV
jgi:(1->4)-alpha-D-glucan 1-alpha-D-glucosylmutase